MEEVRSKLESLRNFYEYTFLSSKGEKEKEINDRIKDIEILLKPLESDPVLASEVGCIRGLAYSCLSDYQAQAETLLTNAVKHSHTDARCWCALATTLWKKGDKESAKQCLLECVTHAPNVEAYCELSILCRQLGTAERMESIRESIDYSKRGIELDVASAKAWYTMGNALFAQYFETKSSSDLLKLIKAYKRSESLYSTSSLLNPDLFYNRGGLFAFTLSFLEANSDLQRSVAIDPTLSESVKQTEAQMHDSRIRIKRLLTLQLFANSQELSKSRQDLVESPLAVGSQGLALFDGHATDESGTSQGKLVAVKIVSSESMLKRGGTDSSSTSTQEALTAPYLYLCLDAHGKFGILAMFDIQSEEQLTLLEPGATVVIADPSFANVHVGAVSSNEVGIKSADAGIIGDSTIVIKMFDRSKIRVNGYEIADAAILKKLHKSSSNTAPPTASIVSDTF